MNVKISNEITIEEPTREVWQYIKRNLVFENPEYHKKVRMGFWVGNTPRLLNLYEKIQNNAVIPFGMINYVKNLEDVNITYSFNEHEDIDYNSEIKLKDYQKPAVEQLTQNNNGILIADCGTGKTVMGMETVARLKKPTLWIAHTKDLVYDARREANKFFDIPRHCIGTITEGKVDIGTHITFATIQTLCFMLLNLSRGVKVIAKTLYFHDTWRKTTPFYDSVDCNAKTTTNQTVNTPRPAFGP